MIAPSRRKDLGRIAKLRCPHCHEVTFYHLRQGGHPHEIYLQCDDCDYDLYIDANDHDEAHRLARLGHRFARREITAREHADAISRNQLGALQQLLRESRVNDCPDCGEAVPAYFDRCWNCGSAVAATAEIDASLNDAIGFPDPIFDPVPLIDHERGPISSPPPTDHTLPEPQSPSDSDTSRSGS